MCQQRQRNNRHVIDGFYVLALTCVSTHICIRRKFHTIVSFVSKHVLTWFKKQKGDQRDAKRKNQSVEKQKQW